MFVPITPAPPCQEPPKLTYLSPRPSTFANYSCCPWAKSILAVDPLTDHLILCAVTCKRWGCAYCAPRKIRRLAFLTNSAKPNRMIRLGVDPALWESPEAAWRGTTAKVPEACKVIRVERGECEYLRVCELHKSGWPHYHCLLRSSFIPQRRLSDLWGSLTGAPVVDIRKIDDTFSSFRYLVKYLTKLHRIEWTDRHVSYSRKFFHEEDLEKMLYPEKTILERIDHHPWKWLADRFPDARVGLAEDGTWHLPYRPVLAEEDISMEELGLRIPNAESPPVALVQRNLSGLEDATATTWEDQSF